jgi:hypothetical protein
VGLLVIKQASGLTTPENFYRARLVQLNMTEAGLDEIPSDDLAHVMKSWTLPAKQSHFYCFWNYDAFLPLCQVRGTVLKIPRNRIVRCVITQIVRAWVLLVCLG